MSKELQPKSDPMARIAFFALVGVTVLAVGAFFNLRTDDPDRATSLVTSADFLAGLRDQPGGDGCIALQSLDHLDVLVVGSSHAGAGVDPLTLARTMNGQATAVCALPAWTIGHFDLLFEFLRAENLTPDRLIWIADIGTVLDLPQSEQSRATAEQVFQSRSLQRRARDRWFDRFERVGSAFGRSAQARDSDLTLQQTMLDEHTELATIRAILDAAPPADLIRLGRALSSARATANITDRLGAICEAAGARFGRLDIVISPTPQRTQSYLQSLENTEFPETQAAFATLLDTALPCAASLRSQSLRDWGLDERHFINRQADPSYDYAVWASVEDFRRRTAEMTAREQRALYDSNHLNLAGADIFTRALVVSQGESEPVGQ